MIAKILTRLYPYGFFYTLRGWALIALSVFLLWAPVHDSLDIVATGLALSFLSVLLFFSVLSLINFYLIKRTVKIDNIIAPEPITSQKDFPIEIFLKGKPPYIFFNLSLKITFQNSKFTTDSEQIEFVQNLLVYQTIVNFPHRGHWQVENLSLLYQDFLGLIKLKYSLNTIHKFKVLPKPSIINSPLPVISSSFREGDATYSQYERSGDPYELKQYHPSDGIKKLAWKIYARTGELIARHNETSFTPEGEVLMYLNLNQLDDEVCSISLDYIEELKKNGLEYRCYHSGELLTSFNNKDLLLDSLLNSVWSLEDNLKKGSQTLVSRDPHKNLVEDLTSDMKKRYGKIVVFSNSKQVNGNLMQLGKVLSKINIQPYFFLFYDKGSKQLTISSINSSIKNWFFADSPKEELQIRQQSSTKDSLNFTQNSLEEGWEVEDRTYL